jgi:hypothetical protein
MTIFKRDFLFDGTLSDTWRTFHDLVADNVKNVYRIELE